MSETETPDEQNDDGRLAERARQLFDESVQKLDAETLSRLNRGRQHALAEASRGGAGVVWHRWAPVAAAVTAAAAIFIVWGPGNGVDELPPALGSDVEILLAEEELELLEDLEFYRWMALDETVDEPGPDDHVG
jgi:hypothetical protein